ncbi:TVP38/TMEM64 family protein [filamentous cyanobacterium CCP1]|nr:TVP38/TMEM64 family protein [filamentous cyanobacterium CCP2]PSB63938.1 TVP38/TMEM64 family protein [filamentous cyanobacterium CCP1]
MRNKQKKRLAKLYALLTVPNTIALLVLLLCGGAGWWFVTQSGLDWSSPQAIVQSIQNLGSFGILAYIAFLVVAIVVGPVPSTPVTVAAGAVWGGFPAGTYGVIGLFLGSLAAYFIGRTLGRSAVQALTGKSVYFSKHRGEIYLGWIVFVSHLFPFLPYDLVSYGAGISGMSLPIFAIANLLGIIPNTLSLTYMGSVSTIGFPVAIGLAIVFLVMLVVFPWGVKRHNWLGLRDTIRLETVERSGVKGDRKNG